MKNFIKSIALGVIVLLTATAASAQQKIGHIDFGEIISSTNEFKSAQQELQTLQETKSKELQGMYEEFQKKQDEANEKLRNRSEANKESVDAELQILGNELTNMQTRIEEVQKVAQEELGKKEQELFEPIQRKVMEAINSVAKAQGYAYVLDISSGSIPYFQGGDDITSEIKTKLGI